MRWQRNGDSWLAILTAPIWLPAMLLAAVVIYVVMWMGDGDE